MSINPLDIILVILLIAYGVAGFRQGFLVGATGVLGLVCGGLLALWLAPAILERFEPSMTVSLIALFALIGCALGGQAIGAMLGESLRARVTWRPAHAIDAGAGAVLSVAALLVVTWVLGSAISGAHLGDLSRYVRTSQILSAVNRVMPPAAQQGLLAFGQVVDPGLFPRFLEPFTPERIAPAQPPSSGVLADPDIRRAGQSVVRIEGVAPSCGRSLAGSGFAYGDGDRVLTNAHVVAGVRHPRVQTRAGRSYDATVVFYNPRRDVAVLAVPGLDVRPLRLDRSARSGDSGAVLGYPGDGPFHGSPARIRADERLRGPDIYGDRQVVREVFSLYAQVRPGNSGGPLISTTGTVTGLVFAASVEDSSTGYALTTSEIGSDASAGLAASREVSTGACT